MCGLRLSIVISNDLGYLQPITFEKLYTNVFIGKDRQLRSTTKNLENTYSYKPILKAICRMAFIAITNRDRFISNRCGCYKSWQILQTGAENMSIVVGSFLLKLKTITMNFEINIFCNTLQDNVHGQVYS